MCKGSAVCRKFDAVDASGDYIKWLYLLQHLPGQDGNGIHEDSIDTLHLIANSIPKWSIPVILILTGQFNNHAGACSVLLLTHLIFKSQFWQIQVQVPPHSTLLKC